MLGDFSCKVAFQLMAYLWPAYTCCKDIRRTVETPDEKAEKAERMELWCIYWVMVAAFTAVQPVLDLFLFWVPLYYIAKLGAAVYLWYPSLSGAALVFKTHVEPLVAAHEPVVDERVETMRRSASGFVSANFYRGATYVQARLVQTYASYQAQAQRMLSAEGAGHAAPAAEVQMERELSLDDAPSPPKKAATRSLSKSASGKKGE